MGGGKRYIKAWRSDPRNQDAKMSDEEIIAYAKSQNPQAFTEV